MLLVHVPRAGLRVRVQLGVRVVDPADLGEVLVEQAVAGVVLVTEAAEQLRERELHTGGLVGVPGRGAEVVAADCGRHRLHLLDADDGLQVVAAGFDLGRRSQDGEAARCTRGLMAHGRDARERRVGLDEERAEVALHAVQLGREVAHMGGIDVGRVDVAVLQRTLDALVHEGGEVLVLFRPVAGEVGLIAAQDVGVVHGVQAPLGNSIEITRRRRTCRGSWWDGRRTVRCDPRWRHPQARWERSIVHPR